MRRKEAEMMQESKGRSSTKTMKGLERTSTSQLQDYVKIGEGLDSAQKIGQPAELTGRAGNAGAHKPILYIQAWLQAKPCRRRKRRTWRHVPRNIEL